MDTQLRLLEGDAAAASPDWHLDDDTRRVGLRGVALARQALQAAHRPPAVSPDQEHDEGDDDGVDGTTAAGRSAGNRSTHRAHQIGGRRHDPAA